MDGSAGESVKLSAAGLDDWDAGVRRQPHRYSDAFVAIKPGSNVQCRGRHAGAQRLEHRIAAGHKFGRGVACPARP
jgi:hypothetical protein